MNLAILSKKKNTTLFIVTFLIYSRIHFNKSIFQVFFSNRLVGTYYSINPTFCHFRIANIHRYLSIFVPNASQMFIKKRKFVNLHAAALRVRPKQHRCILTRYLSSSRLIIAYTI